MTHVEDTVSCIGANRRLRIFYFETGCIIGNATEINIQFNRSWFGEAAKKTITFENT